MLASLTVHHCAASRCNMHKLCATIRKNARMQIARASKCNLRMHFNFVEKSLQHKKRIKNVNEGRENMQSNWAMEHPLCAPFPPSHTHTRVGANKNALLALNWAARPVDRFVWRLV